MTKDYSHLLTITGRDPFRQPRDRTRARPPFPLADDPRPSCAQLRAKAVAEGKPYWPDRTAVMPNTSIGTPADPKMYADDLMLAHHSMFNGGVKGRNYGGRDEKEITSGRTPDSAT